MKKGNSTAAHAIPFAATWQLFTELCEGGVCAALSQSYIVVLNLARSPYAGTEPLKVRALIEVTNFAVLS